MADSKAFTTLCEELERASSLDRLEARGTVRLALKQAGLEANAVSASQLAVVVEKILPAELRTRGVDNPDALCGQLARTPRMRRPSRSGRIRRTTVSTSGSSGIGAEMLPGGRAKSAARTPP